jgi:hypothetical protein
MSVAKAISTSGSFITWSGTYAERMMLPPLKTGSPRIHIIAERKTINGHEETHRDVHVSL